MRTLSFFRDGQLVLRYRLHKEKTHIGFGQDNDLVLAGSNSLACEDQVTIITKKDGTWGTRTLIDHHGDDVITEAESGTRVSVGEYDIVVDADPVERCTSRHRSPKPSHKNSHLHGIVGSAPRIKEMLRQVRRIAPLHVPVLIQGETGTGKELTARAIHQYSSRHQRPFIAVNCGGLSPGMVEDVFFGHERGAFTSAITSHMGVFEQAHGGTLFLDEVGELPLAHQSSLLRVLDSGVLHRIGGEKAITVNFRLICATNRHLDQMVDTESFRADLYHRISAFVITSPPLRRRRSDIPILAVHFLKQLESEIGNRKFTPDALKQLKAHNWPGNVRELRNAILKTAILNDQKLLDADDLKIGFVPYTHRTININDQRLLTELKHYRGNVSAVAEILQIPRSTLRGWINTMPPELKEQIPRPRKGRCPTRC